ncbi:hypothetical protein [Bosea sp. NBC_00550]|uniref:hypothetical protein n=1 Tax=Bosea sp. NBC_00550 TaxID=2969621 RepID=UPI0022305410|nr:hypothetical protein [Bosea sp. NBC_00550]UZF93015.1 hypothetical protein NWE53_02015 [Bosea sp. NBC_00550]
MPIDFDDLARRHAPLKGSFVIEIVPGSARAFRTPKTEGVSFAIRIVDGEHKGRDLRLRLLIYGPEHIVARDVGVLAAWAKAVEIGPQPDLEAALRALWVASRGRVVKLSLDAAPGQAGTMEQVATRCVVEPLAVDQPEQQPQSSRPHLPEVSDDVV